MFVSRFLDNGSTDSQQVIASIILRQWRRVSHSPTNRWAFLFNYAARSVCWRHNKNNDGIRTVLGETLLQRFAFKTASKSTLSESDEQNSGVVTWYGRRTHEQCSSRCFVIEIDQNNTSTDGRTNRSHSSSRARTDAHHVDLIGPGNEHAVANQFSIAKRLLLLYEAPSARLAICTRSELRQNRAR